jgi:peptidoglycan/LPS O-acetylase OafA/YrhL
MRRAPSRGVGSAAAIAAVRLPRMGLVAWLGAISYSLYLLHIPVGGRVINLATRVSDSPLFEVLAVVSAYALAIGAAAVLYAWVENPSRRIAAGIGYRGRPQAVVPAAIVQWAVSVPTLPPTPMLLP